VVIKAYNAQHGVPEYGMGVLRDYQNIASLVSNATDNDQSQEGGVVPRVRPEGLNQCDRRQPSAVSMRHYLLRSLDSSGTIALLAFRHHLLQRLSRHDQTSAVTQHQACACRTCTRKKSTQRAVSRVFYSFFHRKSKAEERY
jgi:hypothetical protein